MRLSNCEIRRFTSVWRNAAIINACKFWFCHAKWIDLLRSFVILCQFGMRSTIYRGTNERFRGVPTDMFIEFDGRVYRMTDGQAYKKTVRYMFTKDERTRIQKDGLSKVYKTRHRQNVYNGLEELVDSMASMKNGAIFCTYSIGQELSWLLNFCMDRLYSSTSSYSKYAIVLVC